MAEAIPTEWTFQNERVAGTFDQHVREQLPWYDTVTDGVAHIARHFLPRNGRLYDIGASTGALTSALEDTITSRGVEAVSLEQSAEMAERWNGVGKLEVADAATFRYQPFDVAILTLVLMFIPKTERRGLLVGLTQQMREGGAIVIVDKQERPAGYVGTVISRLTMNAKRTQGVTADEILRKELSLAGVQRPTTAGELPGVPWFRFGEFVGTVVTDRREVLGA